MINITNIIENEDDLNTFINELKKSLDDDTLILYRGQCDNHGKLQSGKSRQNVGINEEVENGWNSFVGRILSSRDQPHVSSEKRQAILQHYGLNTHYLDLTSNALIAAWFASNKFTKLEPLLWVGVTFRPLERATYLPVTDGFGYINILIIPNRKDLEKANKLLDIRLVEKFERPKRQDAFLLFDRAPLLPDINSFWKYTLKIDRTKFKSTLSMRDLFPTPLQDRGYKMLLNVPYIQVPLPPMPNKKARKYDDICLGVRAIDIVDYVNNDKDDGGIDHKWNDVLLYEPRQFRSWKTLNLPLNKFVPGLQGNLMNSVKIILSPNAKTTCYKYHNKFVYTWPQVGSNDIFFTYSQLEHDKVIDMHPPFRGIWLHRENDLIIAIRVSVGWERMTTKLYGVFLLKDNIIEIQETLNTNYPRNSSKITNEIGGLLAIHELVERGPLVFLPHPKGISQLYFII